MVTRAEKRVVTKAEKRALYLNVAADWETLSRTISEAVARAVNDALNATLSPVSIDNITRYFRLNSV